MEFFFFSYLNIGGCTKDILHDAQCRRDASSFASNETFTKRIYAVSEYLLESGEIAAISHSRRIFRRFVPSLRLSLSRLSENFILKFRSIWSSSFGSGLGYLRPLGIHGRADGSARSLARSLARSFALPRGAVQQEKMARFLALFLTAAYECARARSRAACICRGHGSGCGARMRAAPRPCTLRRVARARFS